MRFAVRLAAAVFLAGWAVYYLVINAGGLGQEFSFILGLLPWRPMGELVMPAWAALVFSFLAGFALAVALEVWAWYEYTRTIRMQRLQILALQKELSALKRELPSS